MPEATPTASEAPASSGESAFNDARHGPTPPGAAASLQAPTGHAVALAGFDRGSSPALLAWHDPADNLLGHVGRHRFHVPPTWGLAVPMSGGLRIELDGRPYLVFAMLTVEKRATLPPDASKHPQGADAQETTRYLDTEVADLSQHTRAGLEFNCVPAAAGNVLMALASRDPLLARALDLESPMDDTAAQRLIFGPTPLGNSTLADGLVGLLNSARASGTRGIDLVNGMRSLFASISTESDYVVEVFEQPGASDLADLCRLIEGGGVGILLILPMPDAGVDGEGEGTPAAEVDLVDAGGGGNKGEDVSDAASPRGDRRNPSGVEDLHLPHLPVIIPTTPQSLKEGAALTDLIGSWQQVEGPNDADFGPGQYDDSTLVMTQEGHLLVQRHYISKHGPVTLTRRLRLAQSEPGHLTIEAFDDEPAANSVFDWWSAARSEVTRPKALPVTVPLAWQGSQIRIGEKLYLRR